MVGKAKYMKHPLDIPPEPNQEIHTTDRGERSIQARTNRNGMPRLLVSGLLAQRSAG